jgi:hypothetical protein
MIDARLLSTWDCVVGTTGRIAIVVLGLGVMVRVVVPQDVLRHLGSVVGIAILLVTLPAIISSLWASMSLAEHLGVAAIIILAIMAFGNGPKQKSKHTRH